MVDEQSDDSKDLDESKKCGRNKKLSGENDTYAQSAALFVYILNIEWIMLQFQHSSLIQ